MKKSCKRFKKKTISTNRTKRREKKMKAKMRKIFFRGKNLKSKSKIKQQKKLKISKKRRNRKKLVSRELCLTTGLSRLQS
jgi:hypothetical protein